MSVLEFAPRETRYRGPQPPSRRKAEMTQQEDDRLLIRLESLCDRWEQGEGARRTRDRRGMRLFRDETWQSGFAADDTLQISSASAVALFDRVAADTLRGTPEPEIEAMNEEEDNAARVAQGALRTNWRNTKFLPKLAGAYRLAGFTRPVGFYHYWRHEANGGMGDVDRRVIPGHRLIVDNRTPFIRDMEFVGFWEEMSRAKLITLFPDKVDEIENAGESQAQRPGGIDDDPLKSPNGVSGKGNAVVDRLVAQGAANTPPYTPVTSIKSPGKGKKADPLSETVKVKFMWIDDPSPQKTMKPKLDPHTKEPLYEAAMDPITGDPILEDDGPDDIVDTPLGPQYIPRKKPKYDMVMEPVIEKKYKYWRHVAYVAEDKVKLWDVAWDGPVPISVLRDRYPAYEFDAAGTALRLVSIAVARNVLWTIIFSRLRKSLAGTWITTANSGLKRNKLINDIGAVFTLNANANVNDSIREFPTEPLDAAYFQLLEKLEAEEEMLLGVTPSMKGQAIGRADSPQTYEQIADQSGGPILDRAKLVDDFIQDAAEIDLWFMQSYYTHEHMVEYETAEGFTTWTEASALVMRGKLAVRVETGSSLGRNVARDRQDANENAQAGFYALPMLGRMGRVRAWRQGLKQKGAIMRMGPQYQWLLGASGAPPATQAMGLRAQTKRSHHKPGGK